MDPHKNGTGGLNPPPPAHNMSVPPQQQHPISPMGQPLPQRPMQPAYMPPRPAHTGSVPLGKPTHNTGLLQKQSHPGAPSSPKPPSPLHQQDKPVSINPVKAPPTLNVPISPMNHNKPTLPADITVSKNNHNSISNYHQMQNQNSVPHQALHIQQAANASQSMQPVHHSQMHAFPQNVPPQANNGHQIPPSNLPQTPVSQKPVSLPPVNTKLEPPKPSPVPSLISIKPSVPTPPKALSATDKAQENSNLQGNNTSVSIDISQNKNIQNTSANDVTKNESVNASNQAKPNSSLPPAVSSANKVEALPKSDLTSKPTDANSLKSTEVSNSVKSSEINTVSITPSVMPVDNANKPEITQNINSSIGQTQNGIQHKSGKIDSNSELKVPVPPKPSIPNSNAASPIKQSPSKPIAKSPQTTTNQTSPKLSTPTKSPVPPSVPTIAPSNAEIKLPSVTVTPVVQQLPSNLPDKLSNKVLPSETVKPISNSVSPKVTGTVSPKKAPVDAKVDEAPALKEDKSKNQEKIIEEPKSTPAVSKEPEVAEKTSPSKSPRGKKAKRKLEDDDGSDEESEFATPSKDRRSKRKASVEMSQEGERKSKRSRNPATVYQSPLPDTQVRSAKAKSTPAQERLVVFFKNEHVALRNTEGSFFICQIAQNVYKSSRKIKIRWLSPTDESDAKCKTFKADYYDVTDFDCILTSVDMKRGEKGVQCLSDEERARVLNILQRAKDRDNGIPQEKSELREDHPDGLDLSLYNDESQLKETASTKKRKRTSTSDESVASDDNEEEDEKSDAEEAEEEAKEKPKRGRKRAAAPKPPVEETEDQDSEAEEEEEEESEEEVVEKPKRGRKKSTGGKAGASKTPAKTPAAKKATRPAPAKRGRAAKNNDAPQRESNQESAEEQPAVDTPPKTPAARRRVVRNFGSGPAQAAATPTPEPKKGGRSTRTSAAEPVAAADSVQSKRTRRSRV